MIGQAAVPQPLSPRLDEMADAGRQMVEIQRQYPGLWVAVKHGQVVEARENPYTLYLRLQERGLSGTTIFRCPGRREAELVGLG